MFGSIFQKAQATVDNAVGTVLNRAAIAVPLLAALGFATVAASIRLHREFDAETANLILAGIFSFVALITALIVREPATAVAASGEPNSDSVTDPTGSDAAAVGEVTGADRELLMAAISTAGPLALPAILRSASRNLPLIVAIAAAAFVMTRPEESNIAPESGGAQPAE